MLKKYLTEGVSFASVNYPFVQQVDGNYSTILEHTTESVHFLIKNAKKFNIDPNRISVMGNSAGALITCYLGHARKLGIKSIFPIPFDSTEFNIPSLSISKSRLSIIPSLS